MLKNYVELFFFLVFGVVVLPLAIGGFIACVLASAPYCNSGFDPRVLIVPSFGVVFIMFLTWLKN